MVKDLELVSEALNLVCYSHLNLGKLQMNINMRLFYGTCVQ